MARNEESVFVHTFITVDRYPDPHPIKGIMTMRRIGNDQLARQIGLSPQRTSRVLNGYDNASEKFMEDCSQVLDMPIGELFRPLGRHGF